MNRDGDNKKPKEGFAVSFVINIIGPCFMKRYCSSWQVERAPTLKHHAT